MTAGPGMGLLLILLTPLVWAVPAALMAAELTAALPVEGGYYIWVKRAFGPFSGFLCAWWTWLYSWVDCAVYPVLFAGYLDSVFTLTGHPLGLDSHPFLKWIIGLVVIVPVTMLNIRGARSVGETAIVFGVALIAPFAVMVALGLPKVLSHPAALVTPAIAPGHTVSSAFSLGLFAVMWNYLGWDSMSSAAGEVEAPSKSFPWALAVAVPLVSLCYALPAAVGIVAMPNLALWKDGSWPAVGTHVAGPWLGFWLATTGLVGSAGLFAATLLAASRIPFVLSADKLLPTKLTEIHPKFGTPWIAILVSAAFYTAFSYATFKDLAVVDVVLYSAALTLEFGALVALRIKEPNLHRPFRIPGGWPVLAFVTLAPIGTVAFGVMTQFHEQGSQMLRLSAIGLLSGPVWWWLAKPWRTVQKGRN